MVQKRRLVNHKSQSKRDCSLLRYILLLFSYFTHQLPTKDVGLTHTQMTVDAGKSCRANQVWVPGASGMSVHLGNIGFCGEAQICHINLIPMLPHTHQEILRLDVSMDDTLGMNVFKTVKELVDEHQYGLQRELAAAEVEKIFQTRSQKIKHHHVILRFSLI